MDAVYVFFFVGAVLGAVLCPLFMPLPNGKNKPFRLFQNSGFAKGPLIMSLCFTVFLIAVEIIFRSLGFRVWLASSAVRSITAILEGMFTTLCYGLFYLTWLRRPHLAEANGQNRTGRFCSLVLGAALLGSVLVRYYSVPLLEAGVAVKDPLKGAEFVFNFIKWYILIIGASSSLCVFLTRNSAFVCEPAGEDLSGPPLCETAVKTNWFMIIRLVGLASVFTILNGLLNMQMLPLYSDEAVYHPNYLAVAAAVLVLGFLAGRSTGRFIRRFTPPAVVLFVLVSCLPLFQEHPQFNMIMSTLLAVAHYTVWVVFTTAVVEYYTGGFWFYGMATVIFFSVVFAFLAPLIAPFVPDGTEYRVLFIVIAAVSFMLLAFRLIFPKQQQEPQMFKIPEVRRQEPFPESSALEDIFKERGLSQREIEVANLLVKEGFGKKEIGERLYISAGTAKLHISKIYQKFEVKTRAEFMALFVNRDHGAKENQGTALT